MKKFNNILALLLISLSVSAFSLEKADIIYTGGWFGLPYNLIGDLPLGHVGIFAGTELKDGKIKAVIIDCVPDYFKPGGIRKVSWKHFTHNFSYPYYGNRTTPQKPTQAQREAIVSMANSMLKPKAYSFTHESQKGPNKFDCVGFTEYLYEKVGLNPTPDDQDSGWGWPLTPSEQFYATVANTSEQNLSYINLIKKKDLNEYESLRNISVNYQSDIAVPQSWQED
ncbi:MAG: hypothetical protein GX447_05225 [Elusimicrobia bacterium]|nr:hypothetical protein [Elusimicrobiota bacterium]